MKKQTKSSLSILFIISVVLATISPAVEIQKGKIDMHGGKTNALTKENVLGMAMGIGAILNKKGSDTKDIKKEEKQFITIDKKDSIEEIEKITN